MNNKYLFFIYIFFLLISNTQGQNSCEDIIKLVKTKDSGFIYYSSNSDAIRTVSFHQVRTESFQTNYFAIVQFTSSFKYYIYQVNYDTKFKYSFEYLNSAGEAFWKYIHPYRKTLGCAPDFN